MAFVGFIKTADHRPTDPPATYHLPTDRLLLTYVEIEDQIMNMFYIL